MGKWIMLLLVALTLTVGTVGCKGEETPAAGGGTTTTLAKP